MLVLTRKLGESIRIGDEIAVRVVEIQSGSVRIAIDAPREIPVHREEIWDQVQAENRQLGRAAARERPGGAVAALARAREEGREVIRIESPRFGPLEVPEDSLLCFQRGLPGFPDCKRFILMDHDRETPLRWLQCIDRAEVAFLVVEPREILTAYDVEVPPDVLALLGWQAGNEPGDVLLLVIINAAESELSANLRAPLVVHTRTRRAHQLILEDPSLSFRQPIGPSAA